MNQANKQMTEVSGSFLIRSMFQYASCKETKKERSCWKCVLVVVPFGKQYHMVNFPRLFVLSYFPSLWHQTKFATRYCSSECQKDHWQIHKTFCKNSRNSLSAKLKPEHININKTKKDNKDSLYSLSPTNDDYIICSLPLPVKPDTFWGIGS